MTLTIAIWAEKKTSDRLKIIFFRAQMPEPICNFDNCASFIKLYIYVNAKFSFSFEFYHLAFLNFNLSN